MRTHALLMVLLAVVSYTTAEDAPSGGEKKQTKRGLIGLGLGYGTLGGYGLGSALSLGSLDLGYSGLALGHEIPLGTHTHTTITQKVPVPVPHPVAVPVEKHVPYPVPAPYAVPVPKPYPVAVPKPVAVPIDRPYPVAVDRPYPVAVPYAKPYAVPYAVPIEKHVPIPVLSKYSSLGYGLGLDLH